MMARPLAALVLVAALGCGDAGAPPPVDAAVAAVDLSASIVEREEIDARIRSRLLDTRLCKIFAITAPSFHGTTPGQRKSPQKRRP